MSIVHVALHRFHRRPATRGEKSLSLHERNTVVRTQYDHHIQQEYFCHPDYKRLAPSSGLKYTEKKAVE